MGLILRGVSFALVFIASIASASAQATITWSQAVASSAPATLPLSSSDCIGLSQSSSMKCLNQLLLGGQLQTSGSVNIASLSAPNELLYTSSPNNISLLPTANNSVLVTNGSGALSFSSTLPTGVTAPASAVTPGTTTVTSGTSNGLLYDNAGTLGNLATANNGVLVTNGSGVPSISSTLPSAVQANITGLGTVTSGAISGLTGINNTPIGATTASTLAGTTLSLTGNLTASSATRIGDGSTPGTSANVLWLSSPANSGAFGATLANASNTTNTLGPMYMRWVPSGNGILNDGYDNISSDIFPSSTAVGNYVAGYFGAVSAGSGNIWGLNPLITLQSGFTATAHGIEVDVNINSGASPSSLAGIDIESIGPSAGVPVSNTNALTIGMSNGYWQGGVLIKDSLYPLSIYDESGAQMVLLNANTDVGTFNGSYTITGADNSYPLKVAGATYKARFNAQGSGMIFDVANVAESAYGPLSIDGSTLTLQTGGNSALTFDASQMGTFSAPVRLAGYTVASLPAAGTAGRVGYVTDQLTACPALGGIFTGGGTVKCLAFDNGTSWIYP